MTIKGTLETFNLRELLQMLAFNQKVGTLVLETERGPRTVYVDKGHAAFLESDVLISQALLRILRRRRAVDSDRLLRAFEIAERSNRFLGSILLEMGLLDEDQHAAFYEESVCERLFNAQLTAINRFEFVDGQALDPLGRESTAIEPMLPVEGLLLELTRKVDHWQAIAQVIPTIHEIFEGTSVAVDLAEDEALDLESAELVVPAIDGYRSLEQIADLSDVGLFTVVQVAASLFQGGGIRPVPTEDLLVRAEDLFSRGEERLALPLLRRSVERGDAPPEARIRIADALEATGDREAAAAELDTYAALSDGENPPVVFQALNRALTLRGGDLPTSARLADFYLRNRAWLAEYRRDACEALATLVHHATAENRPQDAAARLAGFIEAGDAPSEELLTLADLYAADGNNAEAASALYRRADDLLMTERVAPARDLLRRALGYDPSRSDIRRRLMDLDGQARQRRQRRRILLVVTLFGLIAVAAAGAWWSYNREASSAVKKAQSMAERAVNTAEAEAEQYLADFAAMITRIETADTVDVDLGQEASALRKRIRETIEGPQPQLGAYAAELESYAASGQEDTHRTILRGLEQRMRNQITSANAAVEGLTRRSRSALQRGEAAYKAGEIRKANEDLLRARNLAFDEPTTADRARLLLGYVTAYVEKFEAQAAQIQQARDAGDVDGAFAQGRALVRELLDSDLTRSLRFPVDVRSTPAGAEVFVSGKATGQRTPCVVDYSPFDEDTTLHVRLPGRTSFDLRLPTYAKMGAGEADAWKPRVEAPLPVGPRYRKQRKDVAFGYVWSAGGLPVVMTAGGRSIQGIDPATGALQPPMKVDGANRLRLAGWFPGGTEWRITGQRTIWVQPPKGAPWEAQAQGRLERAPAVIGSTLTFVDERGTLYGFDLMTGSERWRKDLGSAPTQAPYASALGILMATTSGSGLKVDPDTGAVKSLAPAARGSALALPLGEGALFLGGGRTGCRYVDAEGAVQVRGAASPKLGAAPWIDASGIAWIDESGVHWIAAKADSKPQHVSAAGRAPAHVAGADSTLYVTTANAELVAVPLSRPDRAVFRLPLGAPAMSAPVPIGDAVFVLVQGQLVAIER